MDKVRERPRAAGHPRTTAARTGRDMPAAAATRVPAAGAAAAAGAAVPETRSAGMVEVRVQDAAELQQALADAVRTVEEAAERYGTGIMITDVGGGCYVVRAHPAVPFGLVREQPGRA